MKTSLKTIMLLSLMTMIFLTGCIQTVSPDTNAPVKVLQLQQFSAKATGELVWILDGDEVGTGKTYTYIVDKNNFGEHQLVVKEKGTRPDSRTWTIIDVNVEPVDEICNGLDDDQNGLVDDGIPSTPTTCGVGACASTGEKSCVNGAIVDSCVSGTPSDEACDGVDNDCDGKIDENIPPIPVYCGIGACVSTQVIYCVDGRWPIVFCPPPPKEVCDGIDNDCDGMVDNGIPSTPTACGMGACTSTGEKTCVNGVAVDSCTPGTPATEICDNIDNDCDGMVDNGIPSTPTTCGVGACASTGEKTCVNGVAVDSCIPGTPATEICDNIDNDCDGTVDNGIPVIQTTCGVGACMSTGEKTCVNAVFVDSCVPGIPVTEICDGTDNDCDGLVDNGIPVIQTTCGLGACVSTGEMSCVNSVIVNTCVPGTPSPLICPALDGDDIDCDGIDDTCDCETCCTTPASIQATDLGSGLPYINITWDVVCGAKSYKIYRALWESNAPYELIGETTAASYKVEYDWKTDVYAHIGDFPRMAPDATIVEKAQFDAELTAFREMALPYYMNYKCPSFFKVQACNDGTCSDLSEPDAGQAKLIHTQEFSEVAELVIPLWIYPLQKTMSTVSPGVDTLLWCGFDICSPSGGGHVLGRFRPDPVPIQMDVWYDTWKEVWAAHPNAYFIAEGYMGGEQQPASGAKGILLLQGSFTMDIPGTHVDAYIWFYTGGASGHPNDGQMDITVDGATYTYELPVQPADWINTHGTPSIKLTKPVRPVLTQIGEPIFEWHMPFCEADMNGIDDDYDGIIDNPGELYLCPDGANSAPCVECE